MRRTSSEVEQTGEVGRKLVCSSVNKVLMDLVAVFIRCPLAKQTLITGSHIHERSGPNGWASSDLHYF